MTPYLTFNRFALKVSARTLVLCLAGLACASASATAAKSGSSKGHMFLASQEERRVKDFKDGRSIVAYHQSGSITSENSDSPWRQATFFAQGSLFKDADGNVIVDVALCEMTDPDGDLTWSVLWRPSDGPHTLEIKAGTGKWKGIIGKGRVLGELQNRSDGYLTPQWEMSWEITNQKSAALRGSPDDYTYHDRGLSFHGPHIEPQTDAILL